MPGGPPACPAGGRRRTRGGRLNAARLLYLVRNLRAPVCLVVTYRMEELQERYPLRLLLSELHRSSQCEGTAWSLTRTELGELLGTILGHPAARAMTDEIMDRAEGDPFYAEELLAARESATYFLGELRGLLLARVERLPRDARPCWVQLPPGRGSRMTCWRRSPRMTRNG